MITGDSNISMVTSFHHLSRLFSHDIMSGPNGVYNTLIHVVVIILIIKLLKRKSSVNQRMLVVSSFMYSTNDLRIPFKVTEWATYNYVLYICAYVCGYVYRPRRGLPV